MDRWRPALLLATLALALILPLRPCRAAVVINEVMYNSPGNPDVEYVELTNTGPAAQDLSGWYLIDDDDSHDRCFLSGTLGVGEFLVVAGRLDLFPGRYPGVTNVNPNGFDSTLQGVGFGLSNTTDELRIFDAQDLLVDTISYQDTPPWPAGPDGNGPSLELTNPLLDNTNVLNWRASTGIGTPGVQNSRFIADPAPQIFDVQRNIPLPKSFQTVIVTARVLDEQPTLNVELYVDTGSGFVQQPMLDDGLTGDGLPGDGVFGGLIGTQPGGSLVRYYISASDSLPQTSLEPPTAPAEFFAYTVDYESPPLSITELLASNQSGAVDEASEREDWVEIRNPGPDPVDLGGMYLTDELSATRRWEFPTTILQPGETAIVWCDGDTQGPLHATFTLPRSGGEIGLFDSVVHGNVRIDGFSYGLQSADVSFGRFPDDADRPDYLTPATADQTNNGVGTFSGVCINELQAASSGAQDDWVELFNRGSTLVDLGGWFLSDNLLDAERYTFPPNTILPPGGRLSLDSTVLGFSLAADGSELLMLTAPDGTTGLDYVDFGPQQDDVSYARLPEGGGDWHELDPPSRDSTNVCSPATPVLSPVPNLRFSASDTLEWDPLVGAEAYDGVRGELALLRASGGAFDGALIGCSENNGGDTRLWAPDLPPPGGLFYLVRGVDFACAFGSYDSGATSQSGFRDLEVAAAAAACP